MELNLEIVSGDINGRYVVRQFGIPGFTKEEAQEVIHRCNCHDELVALIKKTHKEGYIDGYGDGVDTDGCVESHIIDQDEWRRCWNESDAKTTLAKIRSEK